MTDSIETQRAVLLKSLEDLGAEYAKLEGEVNEGRKRLAIIERRSSDTRIKLRQLELQEHAERTKVAPK